MKSEAILYLNLELAIKFTIVKGQAKSKHEEGFDDYAEIDKIEIFEQEIKGELLEKLFFHYNSELTNACEEQMREDHQEHLVIKAERKKALLEKEVKR